MAETGKVIDASPQLTAHFCCDIIASMKMFSRIHQVVRRIPRSRVATYGEVASKAGFPGAARQVVWALRAGSGLPWHRVVGAKGKILLPGEAGLEQRLRLEMEKIRFVNGRVDLAAHAWNPPKTRKTKKTKKKVRK